MNCRILHTSSLLVIVSLCICPATLAGGQVYFSDYGPDDDTGVILRANLDGSDLEVLLDATLAENPGALAIDPFAQKLYWGASWDFSPRVKRANLDGAAVEQLFFVGSKAGIGGIALDLVAGRIYATDPSDCDFCGRIVRANLDGTDRTNWFPNLNSPKGVVVEPDLGWIWWTADRAIYRANLDGTGVQSIISGPYSFGLAVDREAGKLYWTDFDTPSIGWADLDGSQPETLPIAGLDWPRGIAVDHFGGKIYWVDLYGGKLQRANLDGSNVEDLVVGLDAPTGVALFLDDGVGDDEDDDEDEDGDAGRLPERETRGTKDRLRGHYETVRPKQLRAR